MIPTGLTCDCPVTEQTYRTELQGGPTEPGTDLKRCKASGTQYDRVLLHTADLPEEANKQEARDSESELETHICRPCTDSTIWAASAFHAFSCQMQPGGPWKHVAGGTGRPIRSWGLSGTQTLEALMLLGQLWQLKEAPHVVGAERGVEWSSGEATWNSKTLSY